MILGFKEFFDVKKTQPTYFREKILTCAAMEKLIKERPGRSVLPLPKGTPGMPIVINGRRTVIPYHPKIHTFRVDQFDRWRAGMSIQMVYRGKNYSIKDHFNLGLPELQKCKSTQKVGVKWRYDELHNAQLIEIRIDGKMKFILPFKSNVTVASHLQGGMQIVNNDGFKTFYEFGLWFKKDWEGKIIHWTDLRY